MRNSVLILISALILSGCSVKEEYDFLINENQTYTHAVEFTRKLQLRNNGQTKMLVTATYINRLFRSLDPKYEHFIIGIPKSKKNFFQTYLLRLDSQAPQKITPAKKPYVLNLPATNSWTKYYHLRFAKNKSNTLSLSLWHEMFGSASARFIKVR